MSRSLVFYQYYYFLALYKINLNLWIIRKTKCKKNRNPRISHDLPRIAVNFSVHILPVFSVIYVQK